MFSFVGYTLVISDKNSHMMRTIEVIREFYNRWGMVCGTINIQVLKIFTEGKHSAMNTY